MEEDQQINLIMTNISIVKVTALEIDQAIAIVEEYYDFLEIQVRDDRETIMHYLEGEDSGIWIAVVSGNESGQSITVGCVILRPLQIISNSGEVKRLYVKDAYRGRKIAQMLMEALEAQAREAKLEYLYLDTKDDLQDAIKFYDHQGYDRCERYNDNPQATIFMKKKL